MKPIPNIELNSEQMTELTTEYKITRGGEGTICEGITNGTVAKIFMKHGLIIPMGDNKEKKIKKNNYIFQKMSDFFGYFNVITFEPSDLYLVKGGPIERRRFLDINISQYDKEYMISIMKFNKILKKRNDFLKSIEELNDNNIEYLNLLQYLFLK